MNIQPELQPPTDIGIKDWQKVRAFYEEASKTKEAGIVAGLLVKQTYSQVD